MKERNARETNDMRKSESVSVHERRYLLGCVHDHGF